MSPCDIIERYLTVARGEWEKKKTLENYLRISGDYFQRQIAANRRI